MTTTVAVLMTGTCTGPDQHSVSVTLSITVPVDVQGAAVATTRGCGACGSPVHLTGNT